MNQSIAEIVREKYAQTARGGWSSDDAGISAIAQAFGYSREELASIPAQANMGLSCGNPISLAGLKPGETVVDLGSGGGLDVFLAARKVGSSGRAIGIDMTPEMIDLARRNAAGGQEGAAYENVAFHLAEIDELPLNDGTVDVVISNCVINLAPDKRAVFREVFRVLKPGGRIAISDIALKQALPSELAENVAALTGCIAGAIRIEDYEAGLRAEGFEHVAILDSGADLMVYGKASGTSGGCCDGPAEDKASALSGGCCGATKPSHVDLGDLLSRYDLNAYAASVKVFAVKPASV